MIRIPPWKGEVATSPLRGAGPWGRVDPDPRGGPPLAMDRGPSGAGGSGHPWPFLPVRVVRVFRGSNVLLRGSNVLRGQWVRALVLESDPGGGTMLYSVDLVPKAGFAGGAWLTSHGRNGGTAGGGMTVVAIRKGGRT